jgi:hypothetical protein
LEEDLKTEISGKFLDGVLALFEPTDEFEARCLKDAIEVLNFFFSLFIILDN